MDALTYLALTAKAKLVFETPDTFMSFPALSPLSYTADRLNFGVFNSSDNAQRQIYSEFARLVNSLPSKTIFEMGDRFLWDTYGTVLRTAILAKGQMTEEENAAYQQAHLFLNVTDAAGLSTASPQLLAYRQFRDASFIAVQNYKTQQSTAMAATDQAAITQWLTVDEPRLRALVAQAQSDWETKGFKEKVEDAQQVEQSYAARSPDLLWHTWSALFNPDIDLQTDPALQQFAPTSFVPADVFAQDWPTFSVTGAEITQLVAQAPTELRQIFATEGTQPTVDALSFEYRSVALARHWFKPDVFASRFWRLPDGSDLMSDGATPPQGTWPAYIVALVFMRNIRVTMHTDHPAPIAIRTLPPLRYVPMQHAGVTAPMRLAPMALQEMPNASPPPPHPSLQVSAMQAHPIQLTSQHFAVAVPVHPSPAPMVHATTPTAIVHPAPGMILHPLPQPLPSQPVVKPPPPPPPPPVPDPRKDISILAFICRRLPKTPNPDPNLVWDSKPTQ